MLRLPLIVVLILSCITGSVHADDGRELFARGMELFKQQDYPQALEYFLKAKAAGIDRPQVNYNLGVTYYKLQQYQQAVGVFRPLAQLEGFGFLANYNLGLSLAALQQKQEAADAFRLAFDLAADVRQRALAARALRITGIAVNSARGFWRPEFSLAFGQNDNAGLISDNDLLPGSDSEDNYVAGNLHLAYEFVSGVRVATAAYVQKYRSLDEQDYARAGLSLSYPWRLINTRFNFSLSAKEQYLGGEHVLGNAVIGVGVSHHWSPWQLNYGYSYEDIVQRDLSYRYLAGDMGRVRLGFAYRGSNANNSLEYTFETNRRQNLIQDGMYSDYSPQRRSLLLTHAYRFDDFSYKVAAQFRSSDYDKPNDVASSTTTTQVLRADERALVDVALFYRLSTHWQVNAGYSVLRNRSNIDEFDYQARVLSMGVSWN